MKSPKSKMKTERLPTSPDKIHITFTLTDSELQGMKRCRQAREMISSLPRSVNN